MTEQSQIDSKNLSYLEDSLNLESLICKKCETYASQFTDSGCRQLSQTLAQHHRQRFDALYNYLKTH
jgi:hypothetical protein